MEEENTSQTAPAQLTQASGSGSKKRGRRGKQADCWDHFEKKAECKHCKAILCADPTKGTTRLNRHYQETCPVLHPGRQQQTGPSAAYVREEGNNHNLHNGASASKSSTSSDHVGSSQQAAAEDQLLRMIALHGHPSSLVEDVEFVRFTSILWPGFKMPSLRDVEDKCDALFGQEMSSLKDALARAPGLVSLSLGEANTCRGGITYLVAHFIDGEWNLHRRVIRVFKSIRYPDDHDDSFFCEDIGEIKYYLHSNPFSLNGSYAGFVETISSWGLLSKISTILDFTNGTTLDENNECRKEFYEYICPVHLSATQFKLLSATDICRGFLKIADTILDEIGESCVRTFKHLRLSKKEIREISSRLRLNHPWAYDSDWYTLYYVLEILHDVCSSAAEEFADLEGRASFQQTDTNELFRATVGTIYRAIENFCASTSPVSNLCLIELLKVRKKLLLEYGKVYGRVERFEESVVFMKTEIKPILDTSFLSLSIPLVLDPRFKLVYAKRCLAKANMNEDSIGMVEKAVRQLYWDYYHTRHVNGTESEVLRHWYDSISDVINQSGMERDHTSSEQSMTELDDYLQEERVSMKQVDFDILKWWKENCSRFPTVARMARDFLAVPVSVRTSAQHMIEVANHLRRYA